MESEEIRFKIQKLAWIIILPAAVYLIAIGSYVGSSSDSSYTLGKVSLIVLDIMNVFRFLIALSSFLFSVLITDTNFVDYNVYFSN